MPTFEPAEGETLEMEDWRLLRDSFAWRLTLNQQSIAYP